MGRQSRVCTLTLNLILLLVVVSPAGASNISNLFHNYVGSYWSDSHTQVQNIQMKLLVDPTQGNSFAGTLQVQGGDLIAASGKVTPKGAVTITRSESGMTLILTGKLSATGDAIIGRYKIKSHGQVVDQGGFFLTLEG
jgi:hypothetical protein